MTCEKCWADAIDTALHRGDAVHPAEEYARLLEQRRANPCTPREQAGVYWNEATQRDARLDWPPSQRGMRGHV